MMANRHAARTCLTMCGSPGNTVAAAVETGRSNVDHRVRAEEKLAEGIRKDYTTRGDSRSEGNAYSRVAVGERARSPILDFYSWWSVLSWRMAGLVSDRFHRGQGSYFRVGIGSACSNQIRCGFPSIRDLGSRCEQHRCCSDDVEDAHLR